MSFHKAKDLVGLDCIVVANQSYNLPYIIAAKAKRIFLLI